MISRISVIIKIIFMLFFLQNCDDEWVFDIPGCMDSTSTNYDPSATSENGSCYDIEITTIDASSYDEWVYFSLGLSEFTNNPGFENWDLAFKRNNIKTNGGVNGFGGVCAIVDDTQIWGNNSFYYFDDSIFEFDSEWVCQPDVEIAGNTENYVGCYDISDHEFKDCDKNPALDRWGIFDDKYNLIISNYHFFVKDVNDEYYRIWLMGYKDANGETGKISMAFQMLE